MLTNTDLFVMFSQQLLADGVPVFSNDPDQPVDIFSMVPHQFGEFLHLGFKMFQAPHESVFSRRGLLLGKRSRFFASDDTSTSCFMSTPSAKRSPVQSMIVRSIV